MNPIGALYIAEAIEDERRRFVAERNRGKEARQRVTDVIPPQSGRLTWSAVLRFRRFHAAESRG